jgi:UDP-3-O-[3-hydroxymyristoyl] glucosamine N-acyltransferase
MDSAPVVLLIHPSPMKLGDIAASLDAGLEGNAELEIDSIQPLEEAGERDLSFLSNPRYLDKLKTTRAGAVILGRDVASPGCAVLRVEDPYFGFAMALELFKPDASGSPGTDPSARVHPEATIGSAASIGAHVSVGSGAQIGARAVLHPGVCVYPDVVIGDDFVAHANAVIRENTTIGDRVTVLSGAILGSEGFGNIPLPGGGVHQLPQIGHLEIGDDVDIGANTTVDRATIGVTRIKSGAKLDNLVMIAHGCQIGSEALLASQTGLAGSTTVGARVQMGGQAGAAGHLVVGEDARVAGRTGIINDVPAGATISGFPHRAAGRWRREEAALRRLPDLLKRVMRLERAQGER